MKIAEFIHIPLFLLSWFILLTEAYLEHPDFPSGVS